MQTKCEFGEKHIATFASKSDVHIRRLQSLFSDNKKIGFVGCSVGLCNVLNMTEFSIDNISLFDNDELKKNRFLPGIDVKIRLPNKEDLDECDLVLVTPINFYDEIRQDLIKQFELNPSKIEPVFS